VTSRGREVTGSAELLLRGPPPRSSHDLGVSARLWDRRREAVACSSPVPPKHLQVRRTSNTSRVRYSSLASTAKSADLSRLALSAGRSRAIGVPPGLLAIPDPCRAGFVDEDEVPMGASRGVPTALSTAPKVHERAGCAAATPPTPLRRPAAGREQSGGSEAYWGQQFLLCMGFGLPPGGRRDTRGRVSSRSSHGRGWPYPTAAVSVVV
jgi:hypothetical protein